MENINVYLLPKNNISKDFSQGNYEETIDQLDNIHILVNNYKRKTIQGLLSQGEKFLAFNNKHRVYFQAGNLTSEPYAPLGILRRSGCFKIPFGSNKLILNDYRTIKAVQAIKSAFKEYLKQN